MIRINLAKTHGYTSGGTAATESAPSAFAGAGPHPVVKIGAMLLLAMLVYGYEAYNISQLNFIYQQEQQKADAIKKEVDQFGSVKSVVDDLLKEKSKLNEQLEVIRKISQKRAFKLQAITMVQRGLTDDLWLTEMLVEQNNINFKGLSRSPSSVQEIIQNLQKAQFVQTAENRGISRKKVDNDELNAFEINVTVKN